jgi:membrane protease YdiL (CAAX protease family)
MRRASAVLLTSFLFMALHILPLPSFLAAGLVLGVTALATGSIVVPVVIHFLNNASALALLNLAGLETLGDPVWIPPGILVPAVAIFVLSLGYYARRLVA